MIPAGITTATVHLDAPVSFTGDPGRLHVTIAPSVSLIWTATGTPMGSFTDTFSPSPGVELSVQLPHTDQPGFEDGFGNAYTGWYYTATVVYEKDGHRINFPDRDFQLPTGQTEVDLALVPAGQAAPVPQIAPILPVTSIAGLNGAVTLADLQLDLVDNTSDANKPLSLAAIEALLTKLTATGTKTDTSAGLFDWQNNAASGYLLHVRTGPNSTASGATIGVGTDFGSGNGLLVSHKNGGAGLRLVGNPGSSILAYLSGYSASSLINAEVFTGNQGIVVSTKTGQGLADGATTAGSNVFTSATAAFTGADVGATLQQLTQTGSPDLAGAIPSGTTIVSVTNATTVVMSNNSPNTSSGVRFLLGGRVPALTQSLLRFYDTDGVTTLGQVRRGGLFWSSPVNFTTNDIATPALVVNGKAGQTSEILTVLKNGNASGALSVIASGLVTTRFGFTGSNAGDTAQNALNINNYSATMKTLQLKGVAGQTGDQLALQDSAGVSQSRFNKDGVLMTRAAAPVDAQLTLGELAIGYDSADGAPQVVLKAKDVDGTLFTRNLDLRGNVLVAPGGTKYLLTVGDDGALTTTAL